MGDHVTLAYQGTKGRKRSAIRTHLELWQVYDVPPAVNNYWLSHNAALSMNATTYQDHLIPLPPLFHHTHQVSPLTYNIHDRPLTLASHTLHHDLLLHLIVVRYQFVQFDSLLYRLVFFLFCLIYLFKNFQPVFVFSLLLYAIYNKL